LQLSLIARAIEQALAADRGQLAFHRQLVARCRCRPAAEAQRSALLVNENTSAMPRTKTTQLLERIANGDFEVIKLKGLQGGTFCMILESSDGSFIHESSDGSVKEYPKVDYALTWLKRKTGVNVVVVDIEIWQVDANAT